MLQQLIEKIRQDPTLSSTIDINALLQGNGTIDDIITLSEITDTIFEKIGELGLPQETTVELCGKLAGYQYIDEIHELQKGRHVRWIRQNASRLTNGGIIVDIKFLDNGTHVLCMNSQRRFIQYKFDDCLTFQKMTTEEQIVLLAKQSTA
jgi:hypothetical protein